MSSEPLVCFVICPIYLLSKDFIVPNFKVMFQFSWEEEEHSRRKSPPSMIIHLQQAVQFIKAKQRTQSTSIQNPVAMSHGLFFYLNLEITRHSLTSDYTISHHIFGFCIFIGAVCFFFFRATCIC